MAASLWLRSLKGPGVFEVVPTENFSRFGIQTATQQFWKPAELVLFHPGLEFASKARSGRVVELIVILGEETPSAHRCSAVWVGNLAPSRKEKSAWKPI